MDYSLCFYFYILFFYIMCVPTHRQDLARTGTSSGTRAMRAASDDLTIARRCVRLYGRQGPLARLTWGARTVSNARRLRGEGRPLACCWSRFIWGILTIFLRYVKHFHILRTRTNACRTTQTFHGEAHTITLDNCSLTQVHSSFAVKGNVDNTIVDA